MSRLTVALMTSKDAGDEYVQGVEKLCKELGFSFMLNSGSFPEVLEKVSQWTILPEVLIMERPDDMDAQEVIRALGDVAPEGEAESIFTNVPNDIKVYRELKTMGIAEIFAEQPSIDDLRPSLEAIATKELRSVGIDPRRVVYVWSACGGAGGTTFALAFAHHFAKEGRRTLVIDMDIFAGPISFLLNANNGAQETTGLMDGLVNPDRVDALFLERAIQKAGDNLYYLSSRRRNIDREPSSDALPMIVARAQQNFDMIVVDTPWRSNPEPDWVRVNGPSYIIAPPTPQGLLGFATINKELQGSATKAPVTGIVNKQGEFRSNDITQKVFAEDFPGKVLSFPYDPNETGRLFFEQKTIDQMRGKARKPIQAILATLPARAQVKRDKTGSVDIPGSVSGGRKPAGKKTKAKPAAKPAGKKESGGFLSKILKK